ncbi:MAG: hypothetical protein ACE366_22615 [Bradymonadia bacterium]
MTRSTVLPYLRPATWPHLNQVPHHPLAQVDGIDVPMVTYVAQGPDGTRQVITLEAMAQGGIEIDDLAAEGTLALSRLALDFTPKPLVETGGTLLISLADECAAEAVGCPPLMHAAHEALGTERLAAALPARGVLMLGDGRDENATAVLSQWAYEIYTEAGPAGLTPHLLMLRLGIPEGVLYPSH